MGASCICETLQFISPFLVQCVTCFCETLQKSRCGLTHSRLRAQAQVGLKTAGDRQVQAHIMSRKLCRRSRSLTRPTFSRSSSRTTGDELKQIPAKALFYTRSTCAACPRSCRVCSPAGGPSRLKILVTLKADAEYRLKGNTDMRLRFMEPMTTEYTEVMMQLYDGDEVNKETLVADVADRDVGKEPDGVFYELAAESCIPGIETKDCTNIFKEQAVQRHMTLAESSGYRPTSSPKTRGSSASARTWSGARSRSGTSSQTRLRCHAKGDR